MAKTYSKYEHTHVMIAHPDRPDGWEGPFEILLVTNTHVWVPGNYAHLGHAQVVQVGICGPSATAFDEDGNCVMAVPLAWCSGYYDPEEAASIEECLEADARLLSYARG